MLKRTAQLFGHSGDRDHVSRVVALLFSLTLSVDPGLYGIETNAIERFVLHAEKIAYY